MRIGIFGGTFDPPHSGHKKYADEVFRKLSLDRLLVIPTATPPHKGGKNPIDSADRLAMVRILFADDSDVEVSDMEITRGGRSYTYETVTLLREIYPDDELFFILGSDMLLSFHSWRNPEVILSHVKICAVTRTDSINKEMLQEYIEKYFPEQKDRFITCDFDPVEISSTQIRDAIRRGEDVEGLLDVQVMEYIKEKELYL
ncbi:MAG: nicotinate (nicotinamide) nucleotide adenylyltransferase [Acutalibacteraceae bacterium]|nr:nicotinate (nicotinamide) nucleotide adenylyltransferase [Acutalibacteraceae bacterium]